MSDNANAPQTFTPGRIATLVFTFVIIGWPLVRVGGTWLSAFQKDQALKKYDGPIQRCVAAKQSVSNPVIGLDYECAIDVAAGIYAQNSTEALELCKKYQSKINATLAIGLNNPTLAEALCRSQIEGRLKNGK